MKSRNEMGNYARIVASMDEKPLTIFEQYYNFAHDALSESKEHLLEHTKVTLGHVMGLQEHQVKLLEDRLEQDLYIIRGAELVNEVIQRYPSVVTEDFLNSCKEHIESLGFNQ